ncbi:helix-turn-helix transcriptional regulator [Pseudonocardia xinjiangensis]|uniref:helix-turn-helix transcriptional regulator n=1 Tax=Pseudonocardia xinjiangensis TaxID=75289 RepID=UPI003D9347ED
MGRSTTELGEFLRARRAVTSSEQSIGQRTGRRRTPGMRREEVATLAGVSTDYYARLEQGRERHPSEQVLDALATVLGLDAEARSHMKALVRRRPTAQSRPWSEKVHPHLLTLMDGWTHTPAMVLDRCLHVLATNQLASALFSLMTSGDSLVRFVFLDPAARDFYADWEKVARNGVGALRAAAGVDPNDPRLMTLVGELSAKSQDFRRLWARHDVHVKTGGAKRFRHPHVGPLTLTYETFTVNSAPGQQLLIYQAEPGTPAAQALSFLGSLSAGAVTSQSRDNGAVNKAQTRPAG